MQAAPGLTAQANGDDGVAVVHILGHLVGDHRQQWAGIASPSRGRELEHTITAGLEDAQNVEAVWNPAWTPERMSEEARSKLRLPLEALLPLREARLKGEAP